MASGAESRGRTAQTVAGQYLPGGSAPTGPGYRAWLDSNGLTGGEGENSDASDFDNCGVGPLVADDLRDLAFFSSRGPTQDGRLGVTFFSVGTHVQGPASTASGYQGTSVCDQ